MGGPAQVVTKVVGLKRLLKMIDTSQQFGEDGRPVINSTWADAERLLRVLQHVTFLMETPCCLL